MGDLIERLRDGLTLYSLNAEAADRIAELEDAIRHVRCEFEDGTWQARKLDTALGEKDDE